jgi:hypothetical protein
MMHSHLALFVKIIKGGRKNSQEDKLDSVKENTSAHKPGTDVI